MKAKSFELTNLPQTINVVIRFTDSGNYIADLPEYDVFTQAKTREELHPLINDLICTYFDVPKKYQSGIRYLPKDSSNVITKVETVPMNYHMFVSSQLAAYA